MSGHPSQAAPADTDDLSDDVSDESLDKEPVVTDIEAEKDDDVSDGSHDLFKWGPTVRRYRLLTAQEEYRLAVASRTDRQAFDQMILANLRLVLRAARRARSHGVPYEDLVTEGIFGLIRALEKFDPKKGFRFSTYALYWIRQSIDRAVMNTCRTVRIPVHTQKNLRYYEDILRKSSATPEEKAAAQKMVRLIHWFPSDASSSSLQSPTYSDADTTHQDVVVDERETPEIALHNRQVTEHIQSLLATLTPRERDIIMHRFYGDKKKTLAALADDLGISRERVRQIESEAIRKLRSSPQRALLRSFLDEMIANPH